VLCAKVLRKENIRERTEKGEHSEKRLFRKELRKENIQKRDIQERSEKRHN
jgi:hypothetical protein